jgi:hypothetical protein
MEEWRQVAECPKYSVSDLGRVRNDRTDRILKLYKNNNGLWMVGLMNDSGKQRMRAMGKLVATTFLPPPQNNHFDSVIHVNGDLANFHAVNLAWRPRWFSMKYHSQFTMEVEPQPPVRDIRTGETFKSVWDVVAQRGLLYWDVVRATNRHTYVFPTMDLFEWVL